MDVPRLREKRVDVPVLLHEKNIEDHAVGSYQLKQGKKLETIVRGVRLDPRLTRPLWVPEWADQRWLRLRTVIEALQLKAPEAVLSHTSAAEFHGWPVPPRLRGSPRAHVTAPASRVRRLGFHGHKPRRLSSVVSYGITVADGPTALRQVSSALSAHELLMVVEAICGSWRGPPQTTVAALGAALQNHPDWRGFHGCTRLARVLARARDGVGSPQETTLRQQLLAAGFPEPAVGAEVVIGDVRYHPDLSYQAEKIALEYEGDHHRTDGGQWEHDIRREADFRRAGWEYIRVTQNTSPETVSALLRSALEARGRSAFAATERKSDGHRR